MPQWDYGHLHIIHNCRATEKSYINKLYYYKLLYMIYIYIYIKTAYAYNNNILEMARPHSALLKSPCICLNEWMAWKYKSNQIR